MGYLPILGEFNEEPKPYDDGKDLINGGSGADTVSYARTELQNDPNDPYDDKYLDAGVFVDLGSGFAFSPNTTFPRDTLVSIENVETD